MGTWINRATFSGVDKTGRSVRLAVTYTDGSPGEQKDTLTIVFYDPATGGRVKRKQFTVVGDDALGSSDREIFLSAAAQFIAEKYPHIYLTGVIREKEKTK